jgi:2-polyprenyl-6-methoxyphenol hydroxylase-like FAD-dependent oxidoreductase
MDFDRDDTVFARPLMIPQCDTERLLAARLAARGVVVERGVELTEFEDLGDRIQVALRHGDGSQKQVACKWLLGCDGAHSFVRKHLGIEFEGSFEPNDWILADVRLAGPLPQDELSIYWHAAGIIALFPIGLDRFRVVADQGLARSMDKPADPTLADVQRTLDARGLSMLTAHDPIWLAGFRIHERKVTHYGRGRALLAGDAAHIHSPAGGQGMNTGMQDAVNLAWKIGLIERGHGLEEPLLASYDIERSAVGDMVLRNATRLTQMATLRNPLLQWIRNHAFAAATHLTAVQQRAIATLTEMAVCYPHSPLNGQAGCVKCRVRPGDRLPDAEVVELGGAGDRLLTCLHGTTHRLLLLPGGSGAAELSTMIEGSCAVRRAFGAALNTVLVLPAEWSTTDAAAAMAEPGICVLHDVAGQVCHNIGSRGACVLLVRPDGYIGWIGDVESWSDLDEHLKSYVLPAANLSLTAN